jgi:hypothetical protein
MLICLVGDPNDLSGVYLRWRAEQRGNAVLTLPENTIGESWTFQLDRDGHGRIDVEGRSIDLLCRCGTVAKNAGGVGYCESHRAIPNAMGSATFARRNVCL